MKNSAFLCLMGLLFNLSQAPLRADTSPPIISTNQMSATPQASIGWFASPDPEVIGYFVAWGSAKGQCTNLVDVGNTTNVTVTGFSTNVTYYFTVIGYNSVGSQGPPSNEIQYLVRAPSVTAPSIVSDLAGQTVTAGASVSLGVDVTGTGPFSYEWFFNGAVLFGVNSNPLLINNVSPQQGGTYQVVVAGQGGSVTSAVALLTVLIPPAITTDLTNQSAVIGSTVTFGLGVSGTGPFAYQWLFDGANLPGATTNPLVLNNLSSHQAGSYQAVVTGPAGVVTSSVSMLSVLMPPSILADLTNQTVVTGSNIFMEVQATGTAPLNYQWLFNGTALSGATESSLALTNVSTAQSGTYQVVVTNNVGAASSALSTLTVLVPPTILADLTNQLAAGGADVAFNLGTTGTTPLAYQWLYNGVSLAGATTNPLVLAQVATSQAGTYQVIVSNLLGVVQSRVVNLGVLERGALRISAQASGPVAMTFAGVPLQTCTLQFSSDVNGPWQPLSTVATDSNGIFSYTADPTNSIGFYRVLSP